MAQSTRTRRQGSLNIAAFSQKIIQPLGKGMLLRELILRLSGSFTQIAGNNVAATLNRGDEWGLLERIDVVVNGSDVIRTFSGPFLRMLNRFWYGQTARYSPFLGAGGADPQFDSVLIIPFWMPLSVKPIDTALDTSKLSDFRLEVTIAAAATVNTAVPTAVAATLDIYSYESFGLDGDFTDMRIYPIQQVLQGANANQQVQLPVGPLYRGFIINYAASSLVTGADIPAYQVGTNAQLLTATGITNVQLISGTTIFRDMNSRVLMDWQRQRLNFGREMTPNAAQTGVLNTIQPIFQDITRSALADEEAWMFMDLCQDGYLGEGIDSIGFSELYLNLNIAAAGTLTVFPMALYPVRNRAA